MSKLTMITLGIPCVLHDEVPCSFTVRKVLALTLYLAATGQPHPRARLVALFWPEADAAHGLLNLRQTLGRLRQVVETENDTHLRTTGDLVSLDLGPQGNIDVNAFATATSPHATPEQRLAALRSYGGIFLDTLLIDDAPDFMAWVTAQRAHWEACYDLIAERQLQQMINDGEADAASVLGQTWVQHRPEAEVAYRLLAMAQAAAGDGGGARLTLATASRVMADLGLALTPATTTLQRQLTTLPTLPPTPAPRQVVRLPLVGRQDAFAHLRDAYQQMQAGTTRGVLVQGEAGMGKSRLVSAFMQWVQSQGAAVAVGHAYELSGRLPFQPIMEILRQHLSSERAPDDLLDDSWLTELLRLVPELRDRYPDLPLPAEDAAAGTRLLEAVAQLGMALAQRRPLVWVVEDLHWSDEATRDGLLYLLRRWQQEQTPVLVVGTLRSETVGVSPALAAWLAAASPTLGIVTVRLIALSAEQATQTLTMLLNGTVSAGLCGWLYTVTLGNPLYIEHVVQALIERGIVQWQQDALGVVVDVEIATLSGWLPETLRGLLLWRVRHLDVVTQQVLAAAAIVGTRFREEVLVPVAGVDENAVLDALETAERSLLIRVESGQYGFTHDKVAEALYGDMTVARRRVLHRRSLNALEEEGNTSPAELARHALAAEAWEQAVQYGNMAAMAARQVGAYHDAIRLYEQLLQLLSTSPSQHVVRANVNNDTIRGIYNSLGLLYLNVGQKEQAREMYAALLKDAQTRGDRHFVGYAFMCLGRLALEYDLDTAVAMRLLETARQSMEDMENIPGQLGIYLLLTSAALTEEKLAQAYAYAHHGVQLARQQAGATSLAQCLYTLSDVALRSGRWEMAGAAIEESILLFTSERDIDPYTWIQPLVWLTFSVRIASLFRALPTEASNLARQWGSNSLACLGMIRLHLGEGDTGRAALQMAWQIFTERNEHRFYRVYLLTKVWGWLEGGAFETALSEVQQTLQAAPTDSDQLADPTLPTPYCALVDAFHALFHEDAAREPLEQASAFATNKPSWYLIIPATRWCTQHALASDWEAAYQASLQAQAIRDASPTQLNWFDFARYYETEALLRAGDRERAQADADRLAAHLGANRRYRLVWLRMQALLDTDAGDDAAAVSRLSEARELAEQMGLPGEAWQINALLATRYAHLRDAPHAREAYHAAKTGVTALGERITDSALRDHFTQAALSRLPVLG